LKPSEEVDVEVRFLKVVRRWVPTAEQVVANRERVVSKWRGRVATGLCGQCGRPRKGASKSRCKKCLKEHALGRNLKYHASKKL
jgi:hypothetical protein